jgi:hypothetical protein
VSFGNTLAGGSNSLAVTGNAVLAGAATGLDTVSVSGTTTLNGGVVTSTGTQTYSGAVTLGQDTLLTSLGNGDIRLNGGAVGNRALTVNTAGVTRLAGGISVGSVTTDEGGTVQLAGTISTTGGQTYGETVMIAGGMTSLVSTGGGALVLRGGVDGSGSISLATSGNLTVQGDSGAGGALESFAVAGARVDVGGIQTTADLSLDATDLLVLQGAGYQAGGRLSLNPTARAVSSGRASIVKPAGDLKIEADELWIGAGHKMVVSQGSLEIHADKAVLGDLAASTSLSLNVGQLQVRARDAGDFTNAGLKDVGASIVSPKISFTGVLSLSGDSVAGKKVYLNTGAGGISGKNNLAGARGAEVAVNAQVSAQFNSMDADGAVLQPLALKAVFNTPSSVSTDPTALPFVFPGFPSQVRQFDLVNWNLGYRDEMVERVNGIWVFRSLGLNGRWNSLSELFSNQGRDPRDFIEL